MNAERTHMFIYRPFFSTMTGVNRWNPTDTIPGDRRNKPDESSVLYDE
jgi:hypothetical protein